METDLVLAAVIANVAWGVWVTPCADQGEPVATLCDTSQRVSQREGWWGSALSADLSYPLPCEVTTA